MSQGARTRLHLIARNTALPDKVAEARKRYGKPFGFEPGSRFKWDSGPTVLVRWLANLNKEKA